MLANVCKETQGSTSSAQIHHKMLNENPKQDSILEALAATDGSKGVFWEPKGGQRGAKSGQKRAKREAKGGPKEPKANQKGGQKRELKTGPLKMELRGNF